MGFKVNQDKTHWLIRERLAKTTNPRHKLMLERLLTHSEGEAEGDIERVLTTLSDMPHYHTYSKWPEMSPRGRDEVRQFYYEQIVEGGKHVFEFDMDRIVVDDDTIVTEGEYHALYWGHDARKTGFPVDDEEAFYVVHMRMLIVWPYDEDCFITGEDSYSAVTRKDYIEKVDADDVPASFHEYLKNRLASA